MEINGKKKLAKKKSTCNNDSGTRIGVVAFKLPHQIVDFHLRD